MEITQNCSTTQLVQKKVGKEKRNKEHIGN